MPKGNLRPPTPLPTRKEHMDKTYPEAASIASLNTKIGGSGKPPKTPFSITTLGGPGDDDNHDARNARDAFANSQPPVTGLLKRNDNFSSSAGSARLNQTSDLQPSGYPLGGFSGWFDHAEQQEEKSRRAYEEYTKFNKGK